jgi:hypothetical protein
MYFQQLLWHLLQRRDAGAPDGFRVVYLEAQRAAVDAAEGFARRPGALFVSRLKRARWWREMSAAPPARRGAAVEA